MSTFLVVLAVIALTLLAAVAVSVVGAFIVLLIRELWRAFK